MTDADPSQGQEVWGALWLLGRVLIVLFCSYREA